MDAEECRRHIERWLDEHIVARLPAHSRWRPPIPITHEKDLMMIELWDDRCVQVIPNTGERADNAEWRPMETAPRDGTKIVLRVSELLSFTGRHSLEGYEEWWWAFIPDHGDCPTLMVKIEPTGWLPLPEIKEVQG